MFNFFKKRVSTSQIDEKFDWLNIETIGRELDDGKLSSDKVAISLIHLTIYGGLSYKNLLLSKNNKLEKGMLSKNSTLYEIDADKITVEAIAFVWSMITFRSCKIDGFYEDDILTAAILSNQVLNKVLKNVTNVEIDDAFRGKYHGINVLKSSEDLAKSIQKMANVNMLNPENIYIEMYTKIFAQSTLNGIVDASQTILNMHLNPELFDL